MMNRLNAIHENMTALLDSITSLSKDLIQTADAQKATLISIISDLRTTHSTLSTLGQICGAAGATLLDANEDATSLADKINDTLVSIDAIPVGPYMTFVDFCEECGAELHDTDDYERLDAVSVLCADCSAVIPTDIVADEVLVNAD